MHILLLNSIIKVLLTLQLGIVKEIKWPYFNLFGEK